MIKEVYLIFKTHLDIGFTNSASTVVKRYLEEFIPNAIKVGYELKDTDTPFVWTTGSWLINEALKCDRDGNVEKAIRDGIIAWHGLPFTSYTEMMNEALFEYGLSLSDKLCKRFDKTIIASKMTDVPGHTMGMIKHMASHGIEFMHIGVNPATPLPPVPRLFKWSDGENELTVMYQTDYGVTEEFEDFAVAFGFTGDNCGPQNPEIIVKQYKELKEKYPDAVIKAATLDDVAIKLREVKDIPVFTKEIGDTWIHGIGTDPKKVSVYRSLLRYIEENGVGNADLSDNLLLVPEHTWGADRKCHFKNEEGYTVEKFEKLREDADRKHIEETWREQREYLDKAQKVLGTNVNYSVEAPDVSAMTECELSDMGIEVSWVLYDSTDYDRYKNTYMQERYRTVFWAIADFIKSNLPQKNNHGIHIAKPQKAYTDGKKTVVLFSFDKNVSAYEGLPAVYGIFEDNKVELRLIGQKANRQPNAFFVKFTCFDEKWQIHKMGRWINSTDIAGSPLICGVDKGVRNADMEIISFDAPLVCPFGRRLLEYDLHPETEDMYFNLYNNIWNTNHPLWYEEDSVFRFEIKKRYK